MKDPTPEEFAAGGKKMAQLFEHRNDMIVSQANQISGLEHKTADLRARVKLLEAALKETSDLLEKIYQSTLYADDMDSADWTRVLTHANEVLEATK